MFFTPVLGVQRIEYASHTENAASSSKFTRPRAVPLAKAKSALDFMLFEAKIPPFMSSRASEQTRVEGSRPRQEAEGGKMFARTHRRRRFVASSEILTSGLVALLRMTEEGANNRVVEGANPYGEYANSARWARKCVGAIHELPGNCQTPKRAIRESPLLINYK